METFHFNGTDWPATIEVAGRELALHLLDTQTGDYDTLDQAKERPAHVLSWLTLVYME